MEKKLQPTETTTESQNLAIDDVLKQRIGLCLGEFELNNNREMVKMGLLEKAKRGEYPLKAPLGYKNITNSSGKRTIEVDNEIAPFIKKAFELCADGKSIQEIRDELYELGFRSKKGVKVPSLKIQDILQDIIYIGKFYYLGEQYDGNHQRIVSEELFNKVQDILEEKKILFKNKPKKVVIYARTASKEQKFSLDMQIEQCIKFAERFGYTVDKIFTDEGKSAYNLDRPAYNQMIEYCKFNKDLYAVITWNFDRLTRNYRDYMQSIKPMFKNQKIKLIIPTETNKYPENELLRELLLSLENRNQIDCENCIYKQAV